LNFYGVFLTKFFKISILLWKNGLTRILPQSSRSPSTQHPCPSRRSRNILGGTYLLFCFLIQIL
jgi:hypothetical protein